MNLRITAVASLVTLTVIFSASWSQPGNAKCLNDDKINHPCRHSAGDSWCSEHGSAAYAYRDDCLRDQPLSGKSEVALTDSVDKCVDQYADEYRAWAEKEMGIQDKPIRGVELEQWISWCKEGKTSSTAYSDEQKVWPQKKILDGCDFTIRDKKTMDGWRKAGSALGSISYHAIMGPICDKSSNHEVQINGYRYNANNDTYNFDVYLNGCTSIYSVFDEPGTEKFRWGLVDLECEKSNLTPRTPRVTAVPASSKADVKREYLDCNQHCTELKWKLEDDCKGLSESGSLHYYGSPHSVCSKKAYNMGADCQNECFRRYK